MVAQRPLDSDDPILTFRLAKQTFQPTARKVVMQILVRSKSEGGVLLPEGSRQKFDSSRPSEEAPKAVVVSCGPFCRFVKRGDVVLFLGQLMRFKHQGVEMWCVEEEQIVGVERVGCTGSLDTAKEDLPTYIVHDWQHGVVERVG